MAAITFPFWTVIDDAGAVVTGATVTVASVTTKAGTAISTPGATVNLSGADVSVDYDPALKGDAWVVLAVSKSGSTFTGVRAAPRQYLTADAQNVLAVKAKTDVLTFTGSNVNANTEAVLGIGAVAYDQAAEVAAIAAAVWAAAVRTITGGTIGTYTGNTPQTGDAFARIGANGAGLTAIGDARLANLDALMSSRAPATTALSTAVWTNTKAGFIDAAISGVSTGGVSAGDIATAVWATTVRTITGGTIGTYTGNTPQTGDAYARIGAAGAGLTAIGDARVANLDAPVSSRLAGSAYAAAPSAAAIDSQLSTSHGSGAWGGGTGSGLTQADVQAAMTTQGYTTARAVKLDALDAPVSTRLATAGYTAPDNDKTGYKLAPDGIDLIVVEAGVNARQALSPILASACGRLTGAPSGTIVIRGGNVATTRITAATDADGNRTSVTLALPA